VGVQKQEPPFSVPEANMIARELEPAGVRNLDVRLASVGIGSGEMVSAAFVLGGLVFGWVFLYICEQSLSRYEFWLAYLVAVMACLGGGCLLLAFWNHLHRGGFRTWIGWVIGVALLVLAACYGVGLGLGSCYRVARSDREIVTRTMPYRVTRIVYSYKVSEAEARQLDMDLPGVLPDWMSLGNVKFGGGWRPWAGPRNWDCFAHFLYSPEKDIRLDRDEDTYVVTFFCDAMRLGVWPENQKPLRDCARSLSTTTFAGETVRIGLRSPTGPPILVVESTDPDPDP
jgi:hypothetical protein